MHIGLGTAAIGRPQYINLRTEKAKPTNLDEFRQNGFRVLEEAYKLGTRYFDTAPGYGLAEDLLIEWLQTKDDASIKLATKWGYTYVANFDANAKVHEVKEHSLTKLNEQWQVSKALLPYLSVYQIHSATLETGVLKNEAVLNRLAFLKEEHNLQIGLTTTGVNQVEVLKKALSVEVEGKPLFDAFQCTYNILDQSISEINSALKSQNKTLIIKEALANGRLFPNEKYQYYKSLYIELNKLATTYNVGVDAIIMQFCLATLQPEIVLSGASNSTHLQQNLKANTFVLSEDEISNLKAFKIDATQYWNERKKLTWN